MAVTVNAPVDPGLATSKLMHRLKRVHLVVCGAAALKKRKASVVW